MQILYINLADVRLSFGLFCVSQDDFYVPEQLELTVYHFI